MGFMCCMSSLTLLQPSISSCCPSWENGLHIDPHWSIHAVPPTHYTEAQTLQQQHSD